jgi:hypothetical protein
MSVGAFIVRPVLPGHFKKKWQVVTRTDCASCSWVTSSMCVNILIGTIFTMVNKVNLKKYSRETRAGSSNEMRRRPTRVPARRCLGSGVLVMSSSVAINRRTQWCRPSGLPTFNAPGLIGCFNRWVTGADRIGQSYYTIMKLVLRDYTINQEDSHLPRSFHYSRYVRACVPNLNQDEVKTDGR